MGRYEIPGDNVPIFLKVALEAHDVFLYVICLRSQTTEDDVFKDLASLS